MMRISLHSGFKKQYKKLRLGEKKKWKERRDLFLDGPHHPVLRNHALRGEYAGYRSIDITVDLRAIYEPVGKHAVLFVLIDTHSNLYG